MRGIARQAESMGPLDHVQTLGDFQLRNILYTPGNEANDSDALLGVIDLERSEPNPAVRDLVRRSGAWTDRPDLSDAFFAGYGRSLLPAESARFVVDAALDSVRAISYGFAHGDPEVVERGRRTLDRLRTEHCALAGR